ncbi:MAG: hypothetical protein J0H68_02765 [Sphingobacteriia bacterium]|nr:hypothetical protein [Sphingobacteriia bacterium]
MLKQEPKLSDKLKHAVLTTTTNPLENFIESDDINLKAIDEKTGNTLLHYVKSSIIASYLIIIHKLDVNVANNQGITPLEFFIKDDSLNSRRKESIIKIFLLNGANPNVIEEGKESLLHYTVKHDQGCIVKLLIKSKANVNVVDEHGNTPIYYTRCTYIFHKLIEANASIDHVNKDGQTLLEHMLSVKLNNKQDELARLENIKLLFNKGVSVERKDKHTRSVIHLAVLQDDPVLLEELLKYYVKCGFNVEEKINEIDDEGNTALFYVLETHNAREFYRILFRHGIDPNIKNKNGNAVIHKSWKVNFLEDFLFYGSLRGDELRININLTNNCGHTLAHHMIFNKCHDLPHIIHYFLKYEGDLNILDKNRQTCLDLTCSNHDPELKRYIVRKGGKKAGNIEPEKNNNILISNLKSYRSEHEPEKKHAFENAILDMNNRTLYQRSLENLGNSMKQFNVINKK